MGVNDRCCFTVCRAKTH